MRGKKVEKAFSNKAEAVEEEFSKLSEKNIEVDWRFTPLFVHIM